VSYIGNITRMERYRVPLAQSVPFQPCKASAVVTKPSKASFFSMSTTFWRASLGDLRVTSICQCAAQYPREKPRHKRRRSTRRCGPNGDGTRPVPPLGQAAPFQVSAEVRIAAAKPKRPIALMAAPARSAIGPSAAIVAFIARARAFATD